MNNIEQALGLLLAERARLTERVGKLDTAIKALRSLCGTVDPEQRVQVVKAMIICRHCKRMKPLADFGVRVKAASGRASVCKACMNEYARNWADRKKRKATNLKAV